MNRRSISFSHIEGRVWARASKRHNVLFMQPGKTVREGCWWSGKWRAAIKHTKLTALPGQTQFPLNWWPIFSFQRRQREGERGAKKKALYLCHSSLAEATTGPLPLPRRAASTAGEQERERSWCTQELLLLTPLLTCCTCQVFVLWQGKTGDSKTRIYLIQKEPELSYGQIRSHYKK